MVQLSRQEVTDLFLNILATRTKREIMSFFFLLGFSRQGFSVDQAALELRNLPASASWVLGLKPPHAAQSLFLRNIFMLVYVCLGFVCFVVLAIKPRCMLGKLCPLDYIPSSSTSIFIMEKNMILQGHCLKLWAMISTLTVWRILGFPDLMPYCSLRRTNFFSVRGRKPSMFRLIQGRTCKGVRKCK